MDLIFQSVFKIFGVYDLIFLDLFLEQMMEQIVLAVVEQVGIHLGTDNTIYRHIVFGMKTVYV